MHSFPNAPGKALLPACSAFDGWQRFAPKMRTFRYSIIDLMKTFLTALIALFLTLLSCCSRGQGGRQDSTVRKDTGMAAAPVSASAARQDDEEFNVFLLALGTAFVCVVLGATLAGSMLAILFLLSVFLLVSAGVLSVGILVGFYRRSVAAGFRTVLMIACIGGGVFCGGIAFWLINRIFDIHLRPLTAVLTGAFSGLVGGLLLGLVLFTIIRVFLNYCRKKLAF
jgi:hypothetical protein